MVALANVSEVSRTWRTSTRRQGGRIDPILLDGLRPIDSDPKYATCSIRDIDAELRHARMRARAFLPAARWAPTMRSATQASSSRRSARSSWRRRRSGRSFLDAMLGVLATGRRARRQRSVWSCRCANRSGASRCSSRERGIQTKTFSHLARFAPMRLRQHRRRAAWGGSRPGHLPGTLLGRPCPAGTAMVKPPRSDREHTARRADAAVASRRRAHLREARGAEPDRVDQGSRREGDDRGRRGGRRARARP